MTLKHDEMVANILATFDRATDSDLESGAQWYTEAQVLAGELSGKAGVSVDHAAAVIAAFSPRTMWARNVMYATELILFGTRAQGSMARNYQSAVTALASADPISTLNGPKTHNFALNISGDREAVTIDVWALRVAGLDPELNLRPKGRYAAIAGAYRAAARARGVDPATMQATTWVVARNGRAG